MLDYLDTVRSKSIKTRRRYAFIISIVLAGAVGGIWVVTFVHQKSVASQDAAVANADNDPSALGALIQNVASGIGDIKTSLAAEPNPFTGTTSMEDSGSLGDSHSNTQAATSSENLNSSSSTPNFDQVIISDTPAK